MSIYKSEQSNFKVNYPDGCSENIAVKIYTSLLNLEPEYADTDKCAGISLTNEKGVYFIYCEPYKYIYSEVDGKIVKGSVTICDICGKVIDDIKNDSFYPFSECLGYESIFGKVFMEFTLCSSCMDNVLKDYIIPRLKTIITCTKKGKKIALDELKKVK